MGGSLTPLPGVEGPDSRGSTALALSISLRVILSFSRNTLQLLDNVFGID